MDSEEREEIPWSTLVAEADKGIDRRWYVVAIGVGVVIAAVLGFRLLAGATQPAPDMALDSTDSWSTVTAPPPEANLVVAEDDLRMKAPAVNDRVTAFLAEAFVTDFFTNDGSPETTRSLLSAITPDLRTDLQSARDAMTASTFVEWAKVFAIERRDDLTAVHVVYRPIVASDGGFDRLPTEAVEVLVAEDDGNVPGRAGAVASLPTSIDMP